MEDSKTLEWFEKNGLTPPSHTSHGVSGDDLSHKVQPLKMHSWRLEGNRLIAKTDMGEVVNYIDPQYIMRGVDKRGLPIFAKI